MIISNKGMYQYQYHLLILFGKNKNVSINKLQTLESFIDKKLCIFV
jgi:hypothetical protein